MSMQTTQTVVVLRACNARNGNLLGNAIRVARTARQRMRGLLGTSQLLPGEGLLIEPCQGVHGFFMKFDIDVLHVDRHGQVVRMLAPLKRNRMGPVVWRGRSVIELPSGTIAASDTRLGDRVILEPVPAGVPQGPQHPQS